MACQPPRLSFDGMRRLCVERHPAPARHPYPAGIQRSPRARRKNARSACARRYSCRSPAKSRPMLPSLASLRAEKGDSLAQVDESYRGVPIVGCSIQMHDVGGGGVGHMNDPHRTLPAHCGLRRRSIVQWSIACIDLDPGLGAISMYPLFASLHSEPRGDPEFSRADELIDAAARSTRQWLASADLRTDDSASDRTGISTGPCAAGEPAGKHALRGANLPSCSI